MPFDYGAAAIEIRPDIPQAYCEYWQTLAKPGAWWRGVQRVAIARETRNAITCEFCLERKEALSPYGSKGSHDHATDLSEIAIDAVHRIVTDQARITRQWIDDNAAGDLGKPAYVELVGIVVAVFSIDEFHRALDLPLEPLPEPQPGEPSHYVPAHLSDDVGFVPMVAMDGAVGPEADLWGPRGSANVVRALSLAPDALRDWVKIGDAQYLSFEGMGNFGQPENRTINRMQIELVAGRVSSINECFY
ncbi:MAG: hypothetical protein HN712_07375 [Gemmatimonadetes bacterium]|nr:hypothetical protein [Gemmatimonadota bacterium]MBT7860116.1 hypothetical protein [Gemmatimonadota bacterium]